MSHRLQIAFATCSPTRGMLERVAARFASVADVRTFTTAVDGRDADTVMPAIAEAQPDAIAAFPAPAASLVRNGSGAPVVSIEIPADVLLARVDAALEAGGSVAVLPPAGTVTPSTARLLRRLGSEVHVLPYESHDHLRDLVTRCRRIGVKALVGGESARPMAEEAGLAALSLADGQDESAGVMAQAIVKAAVQAAPYRARRGEDLARLGLILEKIAQGAIGPRDVALCVDRQSRVTAAFTPPAASGVPALPAGISVLDAVASRLPATPDGESPVALDLYPLANGAGDGFLVVLRTTPRPAARLAGEAAAPDLTDGRLARLLERVDALIERADALTSGRRARLAPRRFLASLRRRTFLLDWHRVRFFELRSGLVYASMATGETYATNYTLADVAARADARDFFRIHRNVIVNLRYVIEIERYGVSQLRVVVDGPDSPSFVVSRPASAALRTLLKY